MEKGCTKKRCRRKYDQLRMEILHIEKKEDIYSNFPMNKTPQEKNQSDQKNILQMTNIEALYSKHGKENNGFPSTFNLIQIRAVSGIGQISADQIDAFNFPVLSFSIKKLVEIAARVLRTSQFCLRNFPQKLVVKMVTLLANSYHSIAYHNFSHAFNLTMLNYQCLQKQFSLKYLFTQEEYFFILIAGLAHDLNHKGTNSEFEVKIKSSLAQLAGKDGILESMHVRHLWTILEQNEGLNFMLAATDREKARKIVTRLILSTDMGLHFSNLEKIEGLRKSNLLDTKHNSQHKWFLMETIFHACDLGNPCIEYDQYISWAALLTHEFSQQAKLEKKINLQVTNNFLYCGLADLYNDQIWFIGKLVQPLWKQVACICPSLSFTLDNIQKNLKQVQKELEKLKQ